MKHNVIVYIGRVQPPHKGHILTARTALAQANRLIVAIGSHNTPRDFKNPWTAPEREIMFRASLTAEENARTEFVYIENRLYSNSHWVRSVEREVNRVVAGFNFIKPTIGLIGNGKGDKDTAEYVNMFPWEKVKMECVYVDGKPLHATHLREKLLAGQVDDIADSVTPETFKLVKAFTATPEFANIREEYEEGVKEEKKYSHPWKNNVSYTADSVVIQSGRVLMVKRGKHPGKGLWALPGGHVEPNETAYQASLRELTEETSIDVPRKVLEGSLFFEKLFDHPDRSNRNRYLKKEARTADVAFGYKLADDRPIPGTKAGDDALETHFFTFEEIAQMRAIIFEDHADIIEDAIAALPNRR